MQIRGLKWRGVSMWPPEWGIADQGIVDRHSRVGALVL